MGEGGRGGGQPLCFPSARRRYDKGTGCVVLESLRAIPAGEEIRMNYGLLQNWGRAPAPGGGVRKPPPSITGWEGMQARISFEHILLGMTVCVGARFL